MCNEHKCERTRIFSRQQIVHLGHTPKHLLANFIVSLPPFKYWPVCQYKMGIISRKESNSWLLRVTVTMLEMIQTNTQAGPDRIEHAMACSHRSRPLLPPQRYGAFQLECEINFNHLPSNKGISASFINKQAPILFRYLY